MKCWSIIAYQYTKGFIAVCFLSSIAVAQVVEKPQSSGLFVIPHGEKSSVSNEDQIRQYLIEHAPLYGWVAPNQNLTLTHIKTSLTAKHYYFQQHINNIPVDRAEIIVSVDINNQQIQKIYNSLEPIPESLAAQLAVKGKATLDKDKALQGVWATKPRDSKLIASPMHRLVYASHNGAYRLVYRITLPVNKEEGNWEYTLDATTGKILFAERLDTPVKPLPGFERIKRYEQLTNTNTQVPLSSELQRFEKIKALKTTASQKKMRVNGSGYVFDPDPRTALNNAELESDSPAEAFEGAYTLQTLLDIKQVNDQYHLDGPWVSIQEFDEPVDEPNTTTDGNWVAKREDDGFLDVMVYFHLDQNQRYIQSLGFTGEKAIQDAPIHVDTNGFFGMHNAFYLPGANQIVFGKAEDCPPMAEDADVILHEYGHAIHFDINPNWYGGDTGAIGEGFSDYWGASYSISTANGAGFHTERAGHWAGFNDCWEGRFLNRTDIVYSPLHVYQAHELIDDYWSDELWSTPLFQSLLTLIEMGIPREQVDRIVLESHFGLGEGVSMRDMAMATVIAAKSLYPDGPHAKVFREKFAQVNILPSPLLIDAVKIIGGGPQQLLLAGGQFGVHAEVESFSWKNPLLADLTLEDLSGHIETITDPVKSVSVNAGSVQTQDFNIQVKEDVACGALVDLRYTLNYQDPDAEQPVVTTKNIRSMIGAPITQEFTSNPNAAILPGDDEILELELDVDALPVMAQYLQLYLDIRDDLFSVPKVVLRSPAGTRVQLFLPSEWSDKVQGYFPATLAKESIFEAFDGEDATGTWVLEVSSPDAFMLGTVKRWGIKTLVSTDCSMHPNQGDFTIASIKASTLLTEPSSKLSIDPGDTVDLNVRVTNESLNNIDNINMDIVTSENFPLDISTYSREILGALSDTEAKFKFTLPDTYECGMPLLFNMTSSYRANDEAKQILTPIEFVVGENIEHSVSSLFAQTIPDNDITGLVSEVNAYNMSPIDLDNFSVFIYLDHTAVDELKVTLRSPEGLEVLLMDNDRDGTYINGNFPGDYTASGDMSVLNGKNPNGTWTLTLQDTKPETVGTLMSWSIDGSAGTSCNSNFDNQWPNASVLNDELIVDEGARVSLDASSSSDEDGDSLRYSWTQLEGPETALSASNTAVVQFTAPLVSASTAFEYEVAVTDYFGNTDTERVSITVRNKTASSRASSSRRSSGGGGGGGGMPYWLLGGLLFFATRAFFQWRSPRI